MTPILTFVESEDTTVNVAENSQFQSVWSRVTVRGETTYRLDAWLFTSLARRYDTVPYYLLCPRIITEFLIQVSK